jgi:hypothetical protein
MATICSSVHRFFITALSGPRFYIIQLGHFQGSGHAHPIQISGGRGNHAPKPLLRSQAKQIPRAPAGEDVGGDMHQELIWRVSRGASESAELPGNGAIGSAN